jgi:hypothetical protein
MLVSGALKPVRLQNVRRAASGKMRSLHHRFKAGARVPLPYIAEQVVRAINLLVARMQNDGYPWAGGEVNAASVATAAGSEARITFGRMKNPGQNNGVLAMEGDRALSRVDAALFAEYLTNRVCQMLADDVDAPAPDEDPSLTLSDLQQDVSDVLGSLQRGGGGGGIDIDKSRVVARMVQGTLTRLSNSAGLPNARRYVIRDGSDGVIGVRAPVTMELDLTKVPVHKLWISACIFAFAVIKHLAGPAASDASTIEGVLKRYRSDMQVKPQVALDPPPSPVEQVDGPTLEECLSTARDSAVDAMVEPGDIPESCFHGRLRNKGGTCWLSAGINMLLLSKPIADLMRERWYKKIAEMERATSAERVESYKQELVSMFESDSCPNRETADLEQYIFSLIYNILIEGKNISKDSGRIGPDIGTRVKSLAITLGEREDSNATDGRGGFNQHVLFYVLPIVMQEDMYQFFQLTRWPDDASPHVVATAVNISHFKNGRSKAVKTPAHTPISARFLVSADFIPVSTRLKLRFMNYTILCSVITVSRTKGPGVLSKHAICGFFCNGTPYVYDSNYADAVAADWPNMNLVNYNNYVNLQRKETENPVHLCVRRYTVVYVRDDSGGVNQGSEFRV